MTTTARRVTKSHPIAAVKAVDVETGVFEAFVSVFGNVDLAGDRIDPAAFDGSLARLKAAGDPLPIIFSHQWDDLSAYLGTASADDIEAVPAGDPRLPAPIADLGGLFVKGQLDVSEPEGRKAAKLLKSRAIKEFSFAYDVLDEARGSDGANELLELEIIETGPTLKGANPLTQLLSAKARQDAAGGIERQAKAYVEIPGSIERHVEAVRAAVRAWAADLFGADLYTVYTEATFPDHVLAYVELWDEPLDGGTFYDIAYAVDVDTIELGDPQAVDFEISIEPRSGTASARSALIAKALGIVDTTPAAIDVDDDPAPEPSPEPDPESSPASPILATIDAELLDLGG